MEFDKKALRLLNGIQMVFLVGFLNPLFCLAVKISAHDYGWLRQLRANVPDLDKFLVENPHLDLSKLFPNLGKYSWHPFNPELGSAEDYAYMGTMVRISVFCLCVLLVCMLARKPLIRRLHPVVEWLSRPEYPRERKICFWFCVMLLAAYPLKMHLGFWVPGIGGWTYQSNVPHVVDRLPIWPENERLRGEDLPAYLPKTLALENRKYIKSEGFLTKNAMFLHFANGEVLPANYELLNLIFPRYYFGRDYEHIRNPEDFARLVMNGLNRRQKGRPFMLPKAISYPVHTPFMPIDYSEYPPVETLEGITTWQVTVALKSGDERVPVVQAKKWTDIRVR